MKKLMLGLILGIMLVAMIGFVAAECTDSDDLDYYSAGEAVISGVQSVTMTVSDKCLSNIVNIVENLSDSSNASVYIRALLDKMIAADLITEAMIGNDNILLEGQCVDTTDINLSSEDIFLFQTAYECPSGCSAGACLTEDDTEDDNNETDEQENETDNNETDNNRTRTRKGLGQIIRGRVKAGVYTNEDGDQIRVSELAQNRFRFEFNGDYIETELEFEEETENNRTKFKVRLNNGRNAEIKIMPNVAFARALARLRLKRCNDININCSIELKEIGEGNNTRLVYEARARKLFKIWGFIKNHEEVRIRIDAETGEEIEIKRPWWAWMATEADEADENE